jgi:hypothetical protein
MQVPGCQPGPLEDRTSLISNHLHMLTLFDCGTDDPQRRTIASRRQRTRITMGEDAGLIQ